MNNMKRQKDMTSEDEAPGLESAQYATEEEWRAITNCSRKNEAVGPKWKNTQLWMCLVMKIKPDSVKKKKNTTIFHRNLECQVHESR